MKQALFMLWLALFSATAAAAATPLQCEVESDGKPCQVEDWRSYGDTKFIHIEGTTTCANGSITLRAYDESGNWIGNGFSGIRGYTFDAIVKAGHPQKLRLRCMIEGQ